MAIGNILNGEQGLSVRDKLNQTIDIVNTIGETLTLAEQSSDPADPAEGNSVIWQSDGTGTGEDGDILAKVTAASITNTYTLVSQGTSFTPTVEWAGGSTGLTYSNQDGYYVSNGVVVFFSLTVSVSAKGSDTGKLLINLPFTSRALSPSTTILTCRYTGVTSSLANFGAVGQLSANTDQAILVTQGGNDFEDTDFGASFSIFVTGQYFI